MEFLAVIGAINVMLAATIALALPIVLAIFVNPVWLVLYGVYFLLVIVFACVIAGSNDERRSAKMGKPGDHDDE